MGAPQHTLGYASEKGMNHAFLVGTHYYPITLVLFHLFQDRFGWIALAYLNGGHPIHEQPVFRGLLLPIGIDFIRILQFANVPVDYSDCSCGPLNSSCNVQWQLQFQAGSFDR